RDEVSVLVFPARTFLFRLDLLLGGVMKIQKPEISSIAQLNYQLMAPGQIVERAGAAPGLLASFVYVFPFPFNVVLCAFYLRWVSRMIDVLLEHRGGLKLSLLGMPLVVYYLLTVF